MNKIIITAIAFVILTATSQQLPQQEICIENSLPERVMDFFVDNKKKTLVTMVGICAIALLCVARPNFIVGLKTAFSSNDASKIENPPVRTGKTAKKRSNNSTAEQLTTFVKTAAESAFNTPGKTDEVMTVVQQAFDEDESNTTPPALSPEDSMQIPQASLDQLERDLEFFMELEHLAKLDPGID